MASYNAGKNNPSFGCLKYKNILTYDKLYKLYVCQKKSIKMIEKELNIGHTTIVNYLKRHNIKSRTINEGNKCWYLFNAHYLKDKKLSESTKLKIKNNHADFSGANHPLFGKRHSVETKSKMSVSHGGTGVPYERGYNKYIFNKPLKNKIRNRDNYVCQHCSMIENKHKEKYNCNLHVHHIDYNKEKCNEDNLITLCCQCNSDANFNKDYWFAYYQYLMEEKKL